METQQKLKALVGAAKFDVCGYSGAQPVSDAVSRYIYKAALPGGGCTNLFKVLMTNICRNDCAYCANQVGRDCFRSAFTPEELARTFMDMVQSRRVEGLFLSSGIAGSASHTMQSMLDAVEILRRRYEYDGYIHLKILPGADSASIQEACKLATRVSINIEAPTAQHLARLSTKKDLQNHILDAMRQVRKLTAADRKLVPSGQTTQFVVGAAGETDRDILRTTAGLYHEFALKRVYYSAYNPIKGSRLEGVPPAPPLREHRLYQTDWLLRVYGFAPGEVELSLTAKGELALNKDPKLVIAQRQPWLYPVDINKATAEELLRVPGIGPLSARRIIEARKTHAIDSVQNLVKMRVVTKRAAQYIWFPGMPKPEKQLSFMPELESEEAEPTLAGVVG